MKIAVCCICRNEVSYIKEWVAFYKNIGFDSVFIYDNVSTDGTTELLSNLDELKVINRIFWPRKEGVPPQRSAYSHFLDNFSREYDYVLISDADEFLIVPNYNVKNFLHDAEIKNPNFGAIAVPWLIFGSSGQDHYKNELIIDRFTKCDDKVSPVVKTIFNPSRTQNMRTHICDLLTGDYVNGCIDKAQWHPSKPHWVMNNNENGAVIYHYYTKSEEEWIKRRSLPKADRAKIEKRNTTEFAQYSSQKRENLVAKNISPLIKSWMLELDLKLENLNKNAAEFTVKICHVNNDWIFGLIESNKNSICNLRFVFDDCLEIVHPVKTVVGTTPFSLKLKWNVKFVNNFNYNTVGSNSSDVFTHQSQLSIDESFKLMCLNFSSAEEHILSVFILLLKDKPKIEILNIASNVVFDKYPLHGEFIKHVINLAESNNAFYLKEFLLNNASYKDLLSRAKANFVLNKV